MYSLFKQATIGKNNSKAPSRMQFVERAKWFAEPDSFMRLRLSIRDAWNKLGTMSKEDVKL